MKYLLTLLIAALPAFSTTITFDSSYPRLFQSIEVSVGGNVINVDAGQIGVYLDGTFPALMFCADPLTSLLTGPTPVTAVPENAFLNGARLAWLYNTYNSTLTHGWEAAALQLAIWEVVLDKNNDDLYGGQTQVTVNTGSDVTGLAATMLQASAGQSSAGITFWVPDQGPGYSQTLFNASAASIVATPEPATGLLLGAGLLLIGALRRRIS